MISLTVKEVVEAVKGKLIQGNDQTLITGVSTDSRKIKEGEWFVPLVGERFNGHLFIDNAMKAGAVGAFVDEKQQEAVTCSSGDCFIVVKDTLQALHALAKYYMSKFSIPVIGVTGSTGKTSTKDMIYAVLSKKYHVHKNEGNLNNHIGLPLTIFGLNNRHEMAIFEMGMSGLGEIDQLSEMVRPNIGVITNIGLSHIEHLGSQENILKAKMEITNYFQSHDQLIINGDDLFLKTVKNKNFDFEVVDVGIENSCQYVAKQMEDMGEAGIRFHLQADGKCHSFELRVPGQHNVYNALFSIAIGLKFDMQISEIQEALKGFEGSQMRLNILSAPQQIKVINDAYNASPDSMKAALAVLNKISAKRKIACLGDMLEMGTHAKDGHYLVGLEVAKQDVDMLVVIGEYAQSVVKGAIEGGFEPRNIFVCSGNKAAIDLLEEKLQPLDAVLIKGSRGMKMEEIVEYIQERS